MASPQYRKASVGPAARLKPSVSLKERTARVLAERIESMGRAVAEAQGTPYGNEMISAEEERRLFWLRDPTVDEQALWAAGTNTPAEISKKLYPHRWKILGAGGRIKLPEQVRWAERQLSMGPPEGTPTPPEPEPVEPQVSFTPPNPEPGGGAAQPLVPPSLPVAPPPGLLPGAQPGVLPGQLSPVPPQPPPAAVPGVLPGALPGALPGVGPGILPPRPLPRSGELPPPGILPLGG